MNRAWRRLHVHLLLVMLAAITLGHTGSADASCPVTGPSTVSFGTISVPRDLPVGAQIGSTQSVTYHVNCSISVLGYNLIMYSNSSLSSVPNVWNTGYPGIGIKVLDTSFGAAPGTYMSAIPASSQTNYGPNVAKGVAYSGNYVFTYQLIKTGQVTASGPLNASFMFQLRDKDIQGNVTTVDLSNPTISATTVTALSCSVSTSSVSVTLPTAMASGFTAVGSTAGTTAFNVGISCAPGSQVYMTLTDSTTPGNTSNLLSLAPSSTASGIALQVLYAGNPVSFGPDSATAGNTNQFLIGASASTSSVPLSVRYYRTGTVGAGTVDAVATFTMSYQ